MIQRVTLRDIAKEVGVHYSTVSMALRDNPRISSEVKAHIKAVADRLGYVPDAALSALNAYRKAKLQAHYQSTIAWIDNWSGEYRLRDQPTFDEYFRGASERARELGYNVEEFSLKRDKLTPDQLSRILRSRGIRGLLLAPQPSAGTWLQLAYEWFSVITFGYSLYPRIFNLVTNHQIHSANLAFATLKDLGYKRIGLYVHKDHDDKVENAYSISHWLYHKKHPWEQRIEPCFDPSRTPPEETFERWFKKAAPDVVLFLGGFDVTNWIRRMGVRVPEDVGVANLSLAGDDETLSGVYENGITIGRTAVDNLVEMLQRGEQGPPTTPIRILVEGVWRDGTTTRPQLGGEPPGAIPAKVSRSKRRAG
ncbi:LacI family transcriptional regulator [Terrimicrobium sacchariphilum]|uniref:LacI family transcriptional regulator n=1 Tax=Terrimicrobium sacchariphilum TaxID=690879 RepID=A0A146G789_TERSA|nr:LacI family DNA-binding transcriptional regulator [Terrimicrobium sacchariphilum]GAT33589.1 LacI family transcriptional regulator [Terrimicrobium sacchariphilum]